MNLPISTTIDLLSNPADLFRTYQRQNLRADIMAGMTVAVILLPQAIAFALIAELPPQMGLYTAIVGAILGALWGSSNHIHTGPTNAISLLVLSVLLTVSTPGESDFIIAAGMLALMAGLLQLLMGFARLGVLVNFVSHSVITGFASGAGILIALGQVKHLFGESFDSHNTLETIRGIYTHIPEIHVTTTLLGIGTMVSMLLLTKITPKLPVALIGLAAASALVYFFNLEEYGVRVIGQLPSSFPPVAKLPLSDLALISKLSTGALAVAAIGLVETSAISRAIASHTNQRLDSNQEFIGQGIANIACGIFSGYPCAGSFSRSAINYSSGARSPLAAIFSSVFVFIGMFTLAPMAAYLPRSALAGILILTAYGMINKKEIIRIWRSAPGDAVIMLVTLLGTLFLHIEFAVLLGILLSFAIYIVRTSTPQVSSVIPDDQFRHFRHQPDKPQCPQIGILDIRGDLYFGAVSHVEEAIIQHSNHHPYQRYLLLRMQNVNQCDFSGIHTLEMIVMEYRDKGGDVYMVNTSGPVFSFMQSTGFADYLGERNFLETDYPIDFLFYRIIDPVVCIYECDVRVFQECQNLPRPEYPIKIPSYHTIHPKHLKTIQPRKLWEQIHLPDPPLLVDIREPREFQRGHIPDAMLFPLPKLLSDFATLPKDHPIVLICRLQRRSSRAVYFLQNHGYENISILEGGMVAWIASGLICAVSIINPESET